MYATKFSARQTRSVGYRAIPIRLYEPISLLPCIVCILPSSLSFIINYQSSYSFYDLEKAKTKTGVYLMVVFTLCSLLKRLFNVVFPEEYLR